MKKLSLFFFILSFFFVLFLNPFFKIFPVFAEDQNDLNAQLQTKHEEIKKLEAHLQDARKTEKTLKSQLDLIDSQTKITTFPDSNKLYFRLRANFRYESNGYFLF